MSHGTSEKVEISGMEQSAIEKLNHQLKLRDTITEFKKYAGRTPGILRVSGCAFDNADENEGCPEASSHDNITIRIRGKVTLTTAASASSALIHHADRVTYQL